MVALYHRNTSDKKKREILDDLSLPLDSPEKKLKAVVATISLGVGVDIRVKNVVCMGLGSNPENMVQEAGRCLRGERNVVENARGLAFFFQKGTVAAIHCPPSSECRTLITEPLPKCQTRSLFRHFDPEFNEVGTAPCHCCYSCISHHSAQGCHSCLVFLETYLPRKVSIVRRSSVRKGLRSSILDLFNGLGLTKIEIETRLSLDVKNFTNDFVKVYDEIDHPSTIQSLWHVSEDLARDLYEVSLEFLATVNTNEEDAKDEDERDYEEATVEEEKSSDSEESELNGDSYDFTDDEYNE